MVLCRRLAPAYDSPVYSASVQYSSGYRTTLLYFTDALRGLGYGPQDAYPLPTGARARQALLSRLIPSSASLRGGFPAGIWIPSSVRSRGGTPALKGGSVIRVSVLRGLTSPAGQKICLRGPCLSGRRLSGPPFHLWRLACRRRHVHALKHPIRIVAFGRDPAALLEIPQLAN